MKKWQAGNKTLGTVFLIGSGPGDPGLMTVKGMQKIRTADVIVYDYLAGNQFIQEARADAELIYVGKKGASHTLEQDDINSLLIRKAKEGKNIVRLKGGDPYVFGRGGEEAEELHLAGVPFEVVPGVTSAVAAPAYAGIPVTHRDHASMVTFITGHEDPAKEESAIDWEIIAKNPGTLIFLMGVKNLPNISDLLIKHGKPGDTPAALVRWGTTPQQVSLFSTLSEIPKAAKEKGIKAPAILVVGSVAGLHENLGWFERKPLFGKRILVTRGREQSKKMADQLAEQGGEPILFPTIQIGPPSDYKPLDKAIKDSPGYDWIIFTSVNGVERFFDRFFQIKADIRELGSARIGAIGPVTSAAIKNFGLQVDLLAQEFTAEGVLDQLDVDNIRGKYFLIPRAESAREILPIELMKHGAVVNVVPVYKTSMPENAHVREVSDLLSSRGIDVITFTSSSTVSHFVELLKDYDLNELLKGVTLASIGPITSQTMQKRGLRIDVEAKEYTIDGLMEAIVAYYSK